MIEKLLALVPRETGQVILRNIVAEIIEKKERIEVRSVAEAKCAAQMNACAFQGRLGSNQALDWPK